MTTDTDPNCWVADLEELVGPLDRLYDALHLARQSQARRDEANASLATAEAALSVAVGSDAPPSSFQAEALRVAAARIVVEALPPVVPIDPEYPNLVVDRIAAWFRLNPATLGAPPLCLAELRHHYEMHHNDPLTPRKTDEEVRVLDAFSLVAERHFKLQKTAKLLSLPLPLGNAVADRARGFLAFVPEWEQHIELVSKTREAVDHVDAKRRASDELHHCPLWGGQSVGPLMAVDVFPDGPWTEARAMHDGLPSAPAPALVGAL